MVLFVHTTPNKNVKDIVKDGEIKSYAKTKRIGSGQGSNMMNPDAVFLSVIFDYYKVVIPNYLKNTYFFFDKSILSTNTPSHYCNYWQFGKITDICIKFKKSESINDNIECWAKSYTSKYNVKKDPETYIFGPFINFGSAKNEIIFKDSVNFKSLVGIYSHNAKWKHPLLMTTQNELKDFLNKYGIEDTDTNPRKHYFIPYTRGLANDDENIKVRNKWLEWASKQKYNSSELKKWKTYYNRNKTRKLKH